ncbi:ThiF family adenylyltransferase [Staphylococcus pseudintermedius]|nr:ThiF family adenylyltransferase [Staphylococcus pseudintermedius]
MRLKDGVTIRYENNSLLINKGTIEYQIKDPHKFYYNIVMQESYSDIPRDVYDFLYSNGLICKDYDNKQTAPYLERNLYFWEAISDTSNINPVNLQEKISRKTVTIIGCGGIGTVVIDNLQRMGIKKLILIDFDKVEKSNLNRQIIFDETDIGKSKEEVVADKVFKEVQVQYINKKIVCENDLDIKRLQDTDIIVNCADTPKNINHIIGSFCLKNEIPFISGRVGIETGEWGPIYDSQNTYEFLKENHFENKIKGSLAPTNSIVGCFIAYDIILYLTQDVFKYPIYKRKIINFKNLNIEVEE